MRAVLGLSILLLSCAAAAQGPLPREHGSTGRELSPSPWLDLAPPAPELPRDDGQAPGLRLGLGGTLAPSTLDRLDAHDPHRLLERGLAGDGTATGVSPYLPERLGATLTFPF